MNEHVQVSLWLIGGIIIAIALIVFGAWLDRRNAQKEARRGHDTTEAD